LKSNDYKPLLYLKWVPTPKNKRKQKHIKYNENQAFTKSIISFVFKKKTFFCQKLLIGCLLDEDKALYLQPKEQKRKQNNGNKKI
jgi:hypothetical protein